MFLVRFIAMVAYIFRFLKKQHHFNQGFIDPYLGTISKNYPQPIDPEVLKKIKKYYCLGIPLTCAVYNQLYGLPLTRQEQINAVMAAIGTPLIDDFTDRKTLDNLAVSQLLLSPETYTPLTVEEATVKDIIISIKKNVPDPKAALQAFYQGVEAQQNTEKQLQPGLSQDELLQLSLEKGAWSHVIFHYLLNTVPTKQVVDVMLHMGGLLQMSNDIFDVYKDYKDGIFTFANTHTNFPQLEIYYTQECRQFCKNTRGLPFKHAQKERFIMFIAIIMGRGLVALRQYKNIQQKQGGGILQYDKLPRHQLITDMEKPINMWRTIFATHDIVSS